jgi:hypothetical protein
MKKVERLLDRGEVIAAIELLETHVDRNPGDAEAYWSLACIYKDYSAVEDIRAERRYLVKALSAAKADGDRSLVRLVEERLEHVERGVDRMDFEEALSLRTVQSLEAYLTLQPEGHFRTKVIHEIEDIGAEKALRTRSEVVYRDFLDTPGGRDYHDRSRIVSELYDIAHDEAVVKGTESAYDRYLDEYVGSPHFEVVESRLWKVVTEDGDPEGCLTYLKRYSERRSGEGERLIARSWEVIYEAVDRENALSIVTALERFPSSPVEERLQVDLFEIFKTAESEEALAQYIETHPDQPYVRDAWNLIVDTHYGRDESSDLKRFLDTYPDSPLLSSIQQRLAEVGLKECRRVDYDAQWDAGKRRCTCVGDYYLSGNSSGQFTCKLTDAARRRQAEEQREWERKRRCEHLYVGKPFEARSQLGLYWDYIVVGLDPDSGIVSYRVQGETYIHETECVNVE